MVENLRATEVKKGVMEILRLTKHTGHGYVTREERIFTMMLKGVDASFSPDEVKLELTNKITDLDETAGRIQVDRHQTANSNARGLALPMFIVKAENKATMDLLTGISSVCWCKTKWEKINRPPVTICYNCFGEGHSMSGGCFKPRQCKLCPAKGEHDCKVELLPELNDRGEKQNPYSNFECCNCGNKGHPPTWSGCAKRRNVWREH